MSNILVLIHSLLRWVILAVAIFGTLRAALRLGSGLAYERLDNVVGASYTGLLDLQVLIGLILLAMAWGTDQMPGLWHPLLTLAAVGVAHAARRAVVRRAGTEQHRRQLAGLALSLALIVIGIQALPA